jgi:xanthine dehydrogenase YagS FAD-binding subunit
MSATTQPSLTEYRAGGTDISERRRAGVSRGPVRDVPRTGPDAPRSDLVRRADGGLTLGALVNIDTLATDPAIRSQYPALALAAGALATPQIRRVGTVGGSLLQHNRCWYYRHPQTTCLKKGGDDCPARTGDHRYGALFDLGPCVAVHPSTLGAALLAYGATVTTDRRELSVADLFGDGSDGRRDHQLEPGELLTAVHLPEALAGERGAYHRATSRRYAEWPLVEATARVVLDGDRIAFAAIAVGAVAPVPLRLPAVEARIIGENLTSDLLDNAGARAVDTATGLPQTKYKRALLAATVTEVLERATSFTRID